jgi:hypothetical protein
MDGGRAFGPGATPAASMALLPPVLTQQLDGVTERIRHFFIVESIGLRATHPTSRAVLEILLAA